MGEIEIGILAGQCLGASKAASRLAAVIAVCEQRVNAVAARVKWMFPTRRPAPQWPAPISELGLPHGKDE